MTFLLDTNICIYLIKQKPLHVYEKFITLSIGSVGLSTITVSELTYGVTKSSNPEKNRDALEQFLLPFEILDFDMNAAIEYGKIRTYLEKKGTPIGPLDTLIAAHAKSLNVILVTNNTREFSRVPHLSIQNWVE